MSFSVDSTLFNWMGLAQNLSNTQEDEFRSDSTSELTAEDLKDQIISNLTKMKKPEQSDSARKRIETERMQALASLSHEERTEFLQAINFLKAQSQRKCTPLRNEMQQSILCAERTAIDRESKRQIQQAKLMKVMVERTIDTLPSSKLSCDDLQNEICFILKVANHFGKKPIDVTEQLKKDYRVKQANDAATALLAEEAKMRKTKRKPNGKQSKKATPVKPSAKPRTLTVKVEKQIIQTKKSKPASTISKKEQVICNLFDRNDSTVSELPRVTLRWRSKNPDDLRKLTDYVQGRLFHRYERMSNEALALQRAQHYLPGIETILAAPIARDKYAFSTNKGYGMTAKLVTKCASFDGVVYFGIETLEADEKVHLKIYHKYFEQVATIEAVFNDAMEADQDEEESSEGWKSVGTFSITPRKDDKLDVCFEDEDHTLVIYPLK